MPSVWVKDVFQLSPAIVEPAIILIECFLQPRQEGFALLIRHEPVTAAAQRNKLLAGQLLSHDRTQTSFLGLGRWMQMVVTSDSVELTKQDACRIELLYGFNKSLRKVVRAQEVPTGRI